MSTETTLRFAQLGLSAPILKAIEAMGYETPSPIQAKSIPTLLDGHDLLGKAQTGTGKTAAFALPILNRINLSKKLPQALILAPTRELAIQVAEAIQTYARHLDGLQVLPIYGGQPIGTQLHKLRRGVHVVVGTPGRILDHINRGTLRLDALTNVVLDEADEMLRMGFIEDVDTILKHTPEEKQIALFSATMPAVIRRVAQRHTREPVEIHIESPTETVETTRQSYCEFGGMREKLDGLTRILEATDIDAMLVFVRTRTATVELAEKLASRGFAAAALNGDLSQELRERTIQRLKRGDLNIVVATDVAARGLDVDRISHVVNFDIPNDPEAYVHRIGRTGRAGREGEAIVFIQYREKRMLRIIEKATGQLISPMSLPTREAITARRVARFKQAIAETIDTEDLAFFEGLIGDCMEEQSESPKKLAAALAFLAQRERPLQPELPAPAREKRAGRDRSDSRRGRSFEGPDGVEPGKTRYRLEVGRDHGAMPKHIVGAIANEAGLDGRDIGHIKLLDAYSLVDLPEGMPKQIFRHLKRVSICGRPLRISLLAENGKPRRHKPAHSDKPEKASKHRKNRRKQFRS